MMKLPDYIATVTWICTCLLSVAALPPQLNKPLPVRIQDATSDTEAAAGVKVLEAAQVSDTDLPSAVISYTWTSALFDNHGESMGSCIKVGSPINERKVKIDDTLPPNVTCIMTLTVTSDSGKMGIGTTILTECKHKPPMCTIDNKRPVVMPGDRVTLTVTCTFKSKVKDTVWTTVKGSPQLDMKSSIEDMYSDDLPDNTYKNTIAIKKGVLSAGKKYTVEAMVTDVNGAQTKTPVTLTVMEGITEGEITCPESYSELEPMTVTLGKSKGPAALSYSLLVESTPGQYKTLSTHRRTGSFRVPGPVAYGNASNTFHVEACANGLKNHCKMTSCHVPRVHPSRDVTMVTKTLENQVDKLKVQGRGLEAAVLLGTLYDSTKKTQHISDIINHVTDSFKANPTDHSVAYVSIDVISNIPPEVLNKDQTTSLTSMMTRATDLFLKKNLKVPERFISAIDMWLGKAAAAGLSDMDVKDVAEKVVHAESSGLEVGNSHTQDMTSSRVTSYNGIPGNHVHCKDGSNNDLHVVLGPSVRERTGSNTLKFKVRAFKNRPKHLTEPDRATIAPIVDMSFFDPETHEEQEISDLASPASIYFTLHKEHVDSDKPAECLYWCPYSQEWMSEGVETGVQTSTTVECKTSHFSTYTVVHAYHSYNRDHNVAWIVGTVLALIIAMILIILLIIWISCKAKRKRVDDNSRSNSRQGNRNDDDDKRRNGDDKRRNGDDKRRNDDDRRRNDRDELTRADSPGQDNYTRNIYDNRPGSTDGLKRGIY